MSEKKLKSWGESYNPAFHYSSDTHCPHCYWQLNGMTTQEEGGVLPQWYFTFVVGFTINTPTSAREGVVGAFIVECQGCFEKYWFHAKTGHVETCVRVRKWPKIEPPH